MNKKILSIGAHSFEGVDSFDWFQELPNIADYDVVILDIPRVFAYWSLAGRLRDLRNGHYLLSTPNQGDRKVKSNLQLVGRKLLEMLEFDVTVYALYTPAIGIWRKEAAGGHERFVNTDEWCPVSFATVQEAGKTIVVKRQEYIEYFRDFAGWTYYFLSDGLGVGKFDEGPESRAKIATTVYAVAANKVDKPIAVEFRFSLHRWGNENRTKWVSDRYGRGGTLLLLPVVDVYNTQPLIEVLLRQIRGVEETPPPSWVSAVEMPGEAPLKKEIGTEKQGLEAAESKVKELEDRLKGLQKHKQLLYETGLTLQNVVKSTLEELGVATRPSVVTDEFIIDIGNRDALVEVKGVGKSISKDDLGQLVIDKGEHFKATGEDIKGILVGNAWRLLPLEQRDTRDKPVFPKNIASMAQNNDIGLISTAELFKAFCRAREEPQSKEEILNTIIAGKGIVTLL